MSKITLVTDQLLRNVFDAVSLAKRIGLYHATSLKSRPTRVYVETYCGNMMMAKDG